MKLLNRQILFVAVIGVATLAVSPLTGYAQTFPCKTINQGTAQAACLHPDARCDSGGGVGTGRCVFQGPDGRCDCVGGASTVALKSHSNSTLAVLPLIPVSVQFSNSTAFNANPANGSGSSTLEKLAGLLAWWGLR